MSKGEPIKRSKRNNKENITTLDQYFIRKKPTSGDHQSPIKNENHNTIDSSNDAKQQKKPAMATKDEMNGTNHQRKPLTELDAAMTPNTKSTTRRQKPIKPSFVVLRDNNSQDQGTTEAQQQVNDQHDVDTLGTTQSQFNTQIVPLVDTLDSQASITSSPMALGDSQDSFLGPGGVDFRVDLLDSNDSDDEYYRHHHNNNALFFDDLEQVQKVEGGHDSQQPQWRWWSDITGDKRTHQQSFDSDNENEDNTTRRKAINRYVSAPETDNSAYEFSIFSPLSFSHDDTSINNYNSSDDEIGNESPPLQSNTRRSTSSIQQQQQFTSSSSFPFSLTSSSSPLRRNASLSDSNDLLTTLPMSPSPLDQSLDLHVAYPVPRGTHIVDKFG